MTSRTDTAEQCQYYKLLVRMNSDEDIGSGLTPSQTFRKGLSLIASDVRTKYSCIIGRQIGRQADSPLHLPYLERTRLNTYM